MVNTGMESSGGRLGTRSLRLRTDRCCESKNHDRVRVGVKSSPAKFVRFLEFRVVRGRILLFFDSETSSWEQRDDRRIESSKAK